MNSYDINTTITLDGEDVDVEVSYTVTYWGHPGTGPSLSHPGDPPEAPEFEIDKIVADGHELVWNELPEKVQEQIDTAVYEDLNEREVGQYDDY